MHFKNLQKHLERLDHKLEIRQAQIRQTQNLRLWTAVLSFLALVAAAIWQTPYFGPFVVAFFILAFSVLVAINRKLSVSLERFSRLRAFYQRQISRLKGELVQDFKNKVQLAEGADLDLTGPHSLMSLIDETFSIGGEARLQSWLFGEPSSLHQTRERQKLILGLHRQAGFLRKWRLTAPSEGDFKISSVTSARLLQTFLEKPRFNIETATVVLLWLAWLVSFVIYLTGFGAPWANKIAPLLLVGFASTHFWLLGKWGPLFKSGEGLAHHLSLITAPFQFLESPRAQKFWQEPHLPSNFHDLRKARPAQSLKILSRWLALLSVEANPLVYLLINIFTPWNSVFSFFLVREAHRFGQNFPSCLEALYDLEALSSLVHFYHYQSRVFPVLTAEPSLSFKRLYHPLLPRDNAVSNDFAFAAHEKMALITGSNMSGKSTFLRSVGINQTLANMGAPVFATAMTTSLLKVETCIQVHDSLRDGFSYFYAEVQNLKALLKRATEGPPTLYLIDEIFRGTNNRERKIGSQAVIEQLAQTTSLGFVSTHDLELTEIATEQKSVHNFHFRDDVEQGSQGSLMVFHYKIHEGPCPTTNALKIMREAGFKV
jgi:ABC-type multidrug transport system fused ATPase/permease subunit